MLAISSLVEPSVMKNSELLVINDPVNVHWIVALGFPTSCRTHLSVTLEPLNTDTYDTGAEIFGTI